MSDTIPPLYSSSPPPLTKSNFADDGDSEEDEDDDDDEYGKFEEYSAVYDHTVEEILNNSPRKPIKSEPKTTLNSSESIMGKNITDLPNNLHSTTDLNSSSVPLPSDNLHSKISDASINSKILENNSINIENTFPDSAIHFLKTDDVLIVNRDNLSSHDSTSKPFSEPTKFLMRESPVMIETSIDCKDSISESIQLGDESSCDSSSCNVIGSKLNMSIEGKVSSNINSWDIPSIPTVNNCSNFTTAVEENLNDDDFEFDDFQSFSEQIPSTQNFVTEVSVVETSDSIHETSAVSISHKNDMPSLEAVPAQIEINHEHANNDTFSYVTNNSDDRADDLLMSKKLETNYGFEISDSQQTNDVNSAVQKNSNDLSNGLSVFKNTSTDSGNVTTVEPNFSPNFVSNATALESNQITEDIIKAEKQGAECTESNSESALDLADKTILAQSLESTEDDGFGDFEFASAPQGSTLEPLNEKSITQSQAVSLNDDDFCDFESADTLPAVQAENKDNPVSNQKEVPAEECPAFETDFSSFASNYPADESDEFSNFKSTNVNPEISSNDSQTAASSAHSRDNFDEFKASFSETPVDIAVASSSKFDDGADAEFDDFSDFSAYDQSSVPRLSEVEPAAHEDKKFWIDLFPPCEEGVREIDVVSISDLVVASRIWSKLRDVESSQALAFEWSKSTSYNKYLSSLKIDVRNVFGVQWRSNVPRFAANLGCAPLEPSKAAKDLNPVSGQPMELSLSNHPDIVPAAHFDWISSGLVNPLDGSYSTLLDINLLDTFVSCESTRRKGATSEEAPKQKAKDEAIDTEVREFLQSLPDLSFMLVSHIQFPMNPTNTDKSS